MRTLAWAIVVAAAIYSMGWTSERMGGFILTGMPLSQTLGRLPVWSWLIALALIVIGLVMMIRCSREEGGTSPSGFEVMPPPGGHRAGGRRPTGSETSHGG